MIRLSILKCFIVLFIGMPGLAQQYEETLDHPGNRCPGPGLQFTKFTPEEFFTAGGETVRVGKKIRLAVHATDPDGRPLTYSAEELPQNARFHPRLQELEWTPTEADKGRHVIVLAVTNGCGEARLIARVQVVKNRPPVFNRFKLILESGEPNNFNLGCDDPDGDKLAYRAHNLPPGAIFDNETGVFSWIPEDGMVGMYEIGITADDGELEQVGSVKLEVIEEWDSGLLPGLQFTGYWPADSGTYGMMYGPSIELVIYAFVHRNRNHGPSHGRIALRTDILRSTQEDVSTIFIYSFSFDLSIERNPQRRWLIPYFGLDTGGFIQDEMGHEFHLFPYAGIHFWSSRNIFLGARVGYQMIPAHMDRMRGFRFSVGGDITFW